LSVGVFTDKSHQPSPEEILLKLGTSLPLWQALVNHIENHYRVRREFAFYGKNYGWAVRYRKSGKALISLYPKENSFTVQVVLGEAGIAEALANGISAVTQSAIAVANPYPEGRWLFVQVDSGDTLQDVELLLKLKSGVSKNANS
jgi:hypothetical protein